MNSLRYLNIILTALAILWVVQIVAPKHDALNLVVSRSALAASNRQSSFPNSSSQRKQMVAELAKLNKQIDKLTAMFRTGQAKVQISKRK